MFKNFIFSLLIYFAIPSFYIFSYPQMELPEEYRKWYKNTDGSCVQCSIGMNGLWLNCPEASTLLWDTVYGKAERRGSWYERVERYAKSRGMKIFNIEGNPRDTIKWIEWSALTGRFCAMSFGRAHFQTLYAWDYENDVFYVVDNNSPTKVDKYSRRDFLRLHGIDGEGWVVILDVVPTPPLPVFN